MNTADLPPAAFGRRDSVLDCGAVRRFAARPAFQERLVPDPTPGDTPTILSVLG